MGDCSAAWADGEVHWDLAFEVGHRMQPLNWIGSGEAGNHTAVGLATGRIAVTRSRAYRPEVRTLFGD